MHESGVAQVRLFAQAHERGWFDPGRLLVETRYPLGLLRAWTWVDLSARVLAYPKPIFAALPGPQNGQRDAGELVDSSGSDDFNAFRDYQPGDPVKHIFWRRYARSGELVLKEYSGYVEPRAWFDLERMAGGLEERLSLITGWVIQARQQNLEYGLRLPGSIVEPGLGAVHATLVLERLALFGLPSSQVRD
jgi:uncharacterized protein (DUF58 family)